MIRLVLALCLVSCGRAPGPVTAPDPCERDWPAWTDAAVDQLLTPTLEKNGKRYFDRAGLAATARELHAAIAACDAPVPANLTRFTEAIGMTALAGHDLGFTIDDPAYLARARPHVELPELLRSAEFLAAIARPERYRDAVAMIDARNAAAPPAERWTRLLYKSRFLATPDRSVYGRLLVHIPGDPTEQWIQFGIIAPGDQAAPEDVHGVSMVAIARQPGGGRESFIIDYWREASAAGVVSIVPNVEIDQGATVCYDCHKSALMPVRPERQLGFDAAGALVTAADDGTTATINERIVGLGAPDFGGLLDLAAFGPALGPPGRARSDAELTACAADATVTPARLRGAMRCASCHDGTTLGAINFPQAVPSHLDVHALLHPDTRQSMPLVATYVGEGWMPPANDLSAAERAALARCLALEYFDPTDRSGLLADWLRGRL